MKQKPWYHSIPNTLSLARIGMTFVILLLIFLPHDLQLMQLLVVLSIVSDKLDGSIARWIGAESDLGKRLESVADPFFAFSTVLYITMTLDFSWTIFWIGTVLIIIATLGRIISQLKNGKMFYKKSQVTRVAVGLIYLVLLLFIFQLPYRTEVAWIVLIGGLGPYCNYLRLIAQTLQTPPSKDTN